MRRFFGVVLRVLILLVVGMASALTSMRFAIHGREVAVPQFVGMAPLDAEREANGNGLTLFRENRFFSSEVPAGKIISQLPTPGSIVRSGWRVRVAESLGPQLIVIPSVLGQSPRAAEINIRRRGLVMEGIATVIFPGAPSDQVIAQSPPPNAKNVSSPKVGLLITVPESETAYVMPELSGMTLGAASVAIIDAGLQLGNVSTAKINLNSPQLQPSRPEPVIVRQSIPAGQKILSGSTVSVDVLR